MTKQEKIIVIKETTLSSIINDIVTFSVLLGAFWFNYKFIGGNDALDALLFIVFFIHAATRFRDYKRFKEIVGLNDEKKS